MQTISRLKAKTTKRLLNRYPCATFALPLHEDNGVQITVTTDSTVGIFYFLYPRARKRI